MSWYGNSDVHGRKMVKARLTNFFTIIFTAALALRSRGLVIAWIVFVVMPLTKASRGDKTLRQTFGRLGMTEGPAKGIQGVARGVAW